MFKKVSNIVGDAMLDGVFSACTIGVTDGRLNSVFAFGGARENSILDIASVTKVLPTATLALKLIDKGRLKLEDRLIDFVPEFRNSDREKVEISHLLTQSLDFDLKLSDYKDLSADKILDTIYCAEFRSPPWLAPPPYFAEQASRSAWRRVWGEKFYYNNATSILLGLVVEKVHGGRLDAIAEMEIFKPLGMHDTSFHPEELDFERIIASEVDDWRGREIRGEVHDESAWKLREKMIAGSAGVFSTAGDLLKFLDALLNGKTFSEAMNEKIFKGLGFESNQPYMGENPEGRIGKTGFTGSVIILDKFRQKGLVILSNYTYPKRKRDLPSGRNKFFRQVANAVFET